MNARLLCSRSLQFALLIVVFLILYFAIPAHDGNYLWRLPHLFSGVPEKINKFIDYIMFHWMPIDIYDPEIDDYEKSPVIKEVTRGFSTGILFLKHIARQARILADHDTMAVVTATKDTASRHADAQGGFRRHRAFVGFATNTVCAEIFAHHKVDYPVVGSPSKGTCLLNREYREISRMCS